MNKQDAIEKYEQMLIQLHALLKGETDRIANLANTSALLHQHLSEINWVGFYLWQEATRELVVGPFQGLPACVRIPYGKGVCGAAFAERKTFRIADVHQFPGHIACDEASNSELVIPIFRQDEVVGVLDIDSPKKNRFDETDQYYLEQVVRILEQNG